MLAKQADSSVGNFSRDTFDLLFFLSGDQAVSRQGERNRQDASSCGAAGTAGAAVDRRCHRNAQPVADALERAD